MVVPKAPVSIAYPLERLYLDQDFDWVVDTIPAVLAWVPATTRQRPPLLVRAAPCSDPRMGVFAKVKP